MTATQWRSRGQIQGKRRSSTEARLLQHVPVRFLLRRQMPVDWLEPARRSPAGPAQRPERPQRRSNPAPRVAQQQGVSVRQKEKRKLEEERAEKDGMTTGEYRKRKGRNLVNNIGTPVVVAIQHHCRRSTGSTQYSVRADAKHMIIVTTQDSSVTPLPLADYMDSVQEGDLSLHYVLGSSGSQHHCSPPSSAHMHISKIYSYVYIGNLEGHMDIMEIFWGGHQTCVFGDD